MAIHTLLFSKENAAISMLARVGAPELAVPALLGRDLRNETPESMKIVMHEEMRNREMIIELALSRQEAHRETP